MSAVTTHDLPTVAGLWQRRGRRGAALHRGRRSTRPAPPRSAAAWRASPAVRVETRRRSSPAPTPRWRRRRRCWWWPASRTRPRWSERPNMPGTTGERWPNWSLALPRSLEEVLASPLAERLAAILRRRAEPSAGAAVRGAGQRRAEVVGEHLVDQLADARAGAALGMTRSARCLTLASALPTATPQPAMPSMTRSFSASPTATVASAVSPSVVQRDGQAGGLVDAGRQHHDRVLVEDDLQVELHLVDGAHHHVLERLPGREDGPADRERRDPVGPEGGDEAARQRWARAGAACPSPGCRAGRRSRPRRGRTTSRSSQMSSSSSRMRPVTSTARRPLSRRRRRASTVSAASTPSRCHRAVVVGGKHTKPHSPIVPHRSDCGRPIALRR